MAKKRQKKGGSPAKRRKGPKSGGAGGAGSGSGGMMQGMVGGFRKMVGAEPAHGKGGLLGSIVTVLLLIAAAGLLLYRFGR